MQNTIVHHEGATSLEAVATKVKPSSARIKIGLDVHARKKAIVAVARRLAVDLWRLHTGRCTAEQLGLEL
jgi:hypothetical protein